MIAIFVGVGAERWSRTHVDASTRAAWRVDAGDRAGAEALLWEEMRRGPLTPTLVMKFLSNHEVLTAQRPAPDIDEEDDGLRRRDAGPIAVRAVGDDDIRRLLSAPEVPRDAAILGLYRLDGLTADEEIVLEIHRRAETDPPMPWANHLLGLEAAGEKNMPLAVARWLREGTTVPGHEADVDAALWKLEDAREWDRMREALNDPRVASAASPWLKAIVALQGRAIGPALVWSAAASYHRTGLGPIVLAVVAALAWLVFCLRVGRVRERPAFRWPVYLVALALGAASVVPTTFFIVFEETILHLVPNGTPGRDLVFYVLGVGFREELSKLLLFAPLLFALRKRGSPLDVLVCGALVGLGFALVENLQYFERGSLSTALARFLTANFLHMAMTGITAHALDDLLRAKEDRSFDASRTFLLVVLLHGAYDFFLTSRLARNAWYVSMLVFLLLTRWFVVKVVQSSPARSRPAPLVPVFVMGIAVVVATSFVYGAVLVGPLAAANAMAGGIVGVLIVAILFVRQVRLME